MTATLAPQAPERLGRDIARVLIQGDLSQLTADQKVSYYLKVCDSLGLNPYTKPFDYLKLNGREVLYARRDCTDQLRSTRKISITGLDRQRIDDLMVVTATARTADGRTDSAIGAVPIQGIKGEALANALMKAETKAKRRVTLSICGLGMTDESELASIPGAQVNGPVYTPDELGADVDDDGRVIDIPSAPPRATSEVRQHASQYDDIYSGEADPPLVTNARGDTIDQTTGELVEDRSAETHQSAEQQGRSGVIAAPERRPSRADLWQEHRTLQQKAADLGLVTETLVNRATEPEIESANAALREQVRDVEARLL